MFSPTQTANGNFPADTPGDIRQGAATPAAGPDVPDTAYAPTGDAAARIAMAHQAAGTAAIDVPNMSNPGTHAS